MKNLNIEAATKRYNNIMCRMGYEYLTIGMNMSKGTDNWNLRDMVSECAYQLSTYYEDGNINADLRYSDYLYDRKAWTSETGKLKRFIVAYTPFIKNMKCTEGHFSRFDND